MIVHFVARENMQAGPEVFDFDFIAAINDSTALPVDAKEIPASVATGLKFFDRPFQRFFGGPATEQFLAE